MSASFSFLTSGPGYALDLPSSIPSIPSLSTPIVSGVGARSWSFIPAPDDELHNVGMESDGKLIEVMKDIDGRAVEVYERNYLPLAWWFKWKLRGGVLVTHLRGGDGWDRVVDLPTRISIDDSGATPMLFLSKPFFAVPSTRVGYQESALFTDQSRPGWVKVVRPGFLSDGRIVTKPVDADVTIVRGGFSGGGELQMQVLGGASTAADTMRLLLDSLEVV